jgi:3-hydroxybutyryl-CoA dehydratase
MDEEYAQETIFQGRIAHGMLTAGLISAVIGEQLPGHGTVYLKQDLKFMAPRSPWRSGRRSCDRCGNRLFKTPRFT